MKISSIKNLNDLNEAVSKNTKMREAIMLKCLDCSNYETSEVKNCLIVNCPLHPFRTGKNPFRKNNITDEQREKMRERMNSVRNNK